MRGRRLPRGCVVWACSRAGITAGCVAGHRVAAELHRRAELLLLLVLGQELLLLLLGQLLLLLLLLLGQRLIVVVLLGQQRLLLLLLLLSRRQRRLPRWRRSKAEVLGGCLRSCCRSKFCCRHC